MECNICLEEFDEKEKQPIVLECGHTLCRECVESIYNKNKKCPIDGEEFKRSLHELKPNYALLELLEKFKAISLEEAKLSRDQPFPAPALDPRIATQSSVFCPENHIYSRIEATLTSDESCILCLSIKRLKWTCPCNTYLCSICYKSELGARRSEITDIKCSKGHHIFYYSDTSTFYSRKNRAQSMIVCDECDSEWTGVSHGCRICHYDLCMTCLTHKLSNSSHQNLNPCTRGHNFMKIKDIPNFQSTLNLNACMNCNHSFKDNFICLVCRSYIICTLCQYKEAKHLFPRNITCPKGHKFLRSRDIQEFYCITCKSSVMNRRFLCEICSYSMCQNCIVIVVEGMRYGLKTQCRNQHKLEWYHDTTEICSSGLFCDICDEHYENSGSFHCRDCKYDICIKCSKHFIDD